MRIQLTTTTPDGQATRQPLTVPPTIAPTDEAIYAYLRESLLPGIPVETWYWEYSDPATHTSQPAPPIVPVLHANGDRMQTLLDALAAQIEALDAVLDLMARCRPNSRNYTAETYAAADDQHTARMQQLAAVQASLAAEMAQVAAQGKG